MIPSVGLVLRGDKYWQGLGIRDLAGDPVLGVGILDPGDPETLDAALVGILEPVFGEAGTFRVGLVCGPVG